MAELSKLLPVVFLTVQPAVLLIVPVHQVVRAHGASEETHSVRYTEEKPRLQFFRLSCHHTVNKGGSDTSVFHVIFVYLLFMYT